MLLNYEYHFIYAINYFTKVYQFPSKMPNMKKS